MAIETYLTPEQEAEVSKLPPEFKTPLISPSGEEVYSLPQHLDALVREGYTPKYGNQKFRIGLGEWGETLDINATELPSYLERGYKLRNPEERFFEKKKERMETLNAREKAVDVTSRVAGITGSIASGITWGLSDIATRGVFEGLEALGALDEGQAKDITRTQLKARDALGNWGTALEMAGGIGTGGILSAGKTGGRAIFAGALEGATAGTTFVAGREALGDDSIDVEDYLFAVGLGTVLGGLGETVAQGMKLRMKENVTDLPEIKVDDNILNNIRSTNQGVELTETIPLINAKNDIIGFADVAVNSQGAYHPMAKTGLSIEGISFSEGLSALEKKSYTQSFMNKMVGEFGSVSSPSKLTSLDGELKDAFSTFGIKRETFNSEPFFVLTEQATPSPRRIWMDKFSKRIMEVTGKTPEPGSKQARLFEKIFDDNTGLFTREFLEYHNDYDKFLNIASKDIRKTADAFSDAQKTAQKIREEVIQSFSPEKLPDLKIKATELSLRIEERVADILSYNSKDLDNVAHVLRKQAETLKAVVKDSDPVNAYRTFYNAKQDVFNVVSTLAKKQESGKYLSASSRNALKGLVDEYNAVLKSADLIGDDAAQMFSKLDLYSSKMIKTTEQFKKMFKVDNPTQFQRAVKQSFRPREGGIQGSQGIIDIASSDFKAFADVINEAKSKGFLKDVADVDSTDVRKALNNVGKYREYQELSMLMSKMRGESGASGAVTAGASSLGSNLGVHAAMSGVPGGVVLSTLGASLGATAIRKVTDPIKLLRMSVNSQKSNSKLLKVLDSATKGIVKSKTNERLAIANTIGLTSRVTENNDNYVDAVTNQIQMMKETTANIYGTLGDQLIEDALKRKSDKILSYVQENIPKKPQGIRMNSVDARSLDKLLLAAFKPQEAIQSAMLEGDNEVLKHLKEMYPHLVEKVQLIVSQNADEDSKVYKRVVKNNLRKSSVRQAQGVFAKKEDKGGISAGGLTIPEMPVGASIQD